MKNHFRRVKLGERTAVHMEEAKAVCYICVDPNGIASLVVADDEYPGKVAFVIINEMFREFYKEYDQMFLETVTSNTKKNEKIK